MTFTEYQEAIKVTAGFPDLIIRPVTRYSSDRLRDAEETFQAVEDADTLNWIYPALGLAGETGEVIEKLKKVIRDKNGYMSEDSVTAIQKEMGDVLWYLTSLATQLGLSLEDVAKMNLEKVLDRHERNVTCGEGDDR